MKNYLKPFCKIKFTLIYFICAVFTLFLIVVTFYEFKTNPIKISNELDINVFSIIPQGWAFFTRSPREAQVTLYALDKNREIVRKMDLRQTSSNSLYGLKRSGNKVLAELQSIKLRIGDSLFENTRWNYQSNVYSDLRKYSFVKIQNEFAKPIIYGKYALVFQKTVPWAWAGSLKQIKMPAKIILLDVICSDNQS